MRVALEARQRVYDLPERWTDERGKVLTREEVAATEYAGTVLGRLYLNGVITSTMHEAGKRYLELYQAYLKALKAPTGLAKGNGSANEADASDDYVDWAIRAVAHYEVIKAALNDYSRASRVAVELLVLREVEDEGGYLSGMLISGLTFLARKMGLENMPRAA